MAESDRIRAELATLPEFSETRQVDAYGFHGDYLPVLDEMPESPRWTVVVTWVNNPMVDQVFLVPAIDPRLGTVQGYGFPRRFRVSRQFEDGTREVVAEWMDEDCPDPAHVPLRIDLPEGPSRFLRIDVYRGAEERGREFFALAEVFGVVAKNIWKAGNVQADPGFESLPYWSKDYLIDQKAGLGMPLDLAVGNSEAAADHDFSVAFKRPPEEALIEFDLGIDQKMGWLTLFPAMLPNETIVPGYGFPGTVELISVQKRGEELVCRPIPGGLWAGGNPGDNAIRISLSGYTGRWLRLKVGDFAEHDGRKVFALGEASITKWGEVYPVKATRLEGFPEGAERQVGSLTDGLVGNRPALQMVEWFELIERQNGLKDRLAEILSVDAALELRWSTVKKRAIITVAALILFVLVVWVIYWQFSLQRLKLRITEEQHHTEIEQMKLRFFTHISHELRTPLTVIPAPIERAMKEVGDGKLRTYLGVALKNVHELQQLVEQILDLRRIQDGKMKIVPVELELVVQIRSIIDSMRLLAEDKAIDLAFEPAEESFVVRLDPRALKRILGNLISNAIKFTPSGGRVVVGLSRVRHVLMLSVEDTGSGILAEDLPNIFEQHYRGQSFPAMQTHGSGMGLALVQEVAGLLGGRVQVESPILDGHGSRFTVNLPLKKGTDDE